MLLGIAKSIHNARGCNCVLHSLVRLGFNVPRKHGIGLNDRCGVHEILQCCVRDVKEARTSSGNILYARRI